MKKNEDFACLVTGVGSVLVVEVDMNETVARLKEKIQEKEPKCVHVDADQLTLYLAKREDGTWLNCDDGDARALRKKIRELALEIQKMMTEKEPMEASKTLDDDAYFTKAFTNSGARGREIHILVQLPDEPNDVEYYEGNLEIWGGLRCLLICVYRWLASRSHDRMKSRILLLQSLAVSSSTVLFAIGVFAYWQSFREGGESAAHTFNVMIGGWIVVVALFFLLKGAETHCGSKIAEASKRKGYEPIP